MRYIDNFRDTDLVSIITPSYKSKKFIRETINSVFNQDYCNFEMIIVDDFSPDGSAQYIKSILPDHRFKLIMLKENVGPAEARNVALRSAKGKFISFLDSDDTWEPNKLSIHLHYMIKHNIAFTFSAYRVMLESGAPTNKIVNVPSSINFHNYMKNTIIGCLTVVINKEIVNKFEMPNLRSSHDMALWGDILKNNNISAYGINKVLSNYRLVNTSNTSNKVKAAKDVWRVYRYHFNFNLIQSFWYFMNYVFNATLKRV